MRSGLRPDTGFPSDSLSRSSQAHQANSSGIPTGLAASRHLSSDGTGSDYNVVILTYRCVALLIVVYRCLSLVIVAYRCCFHMDYSILYTTTLY